MIEQLIDRIEKDMIPWAIYPVNEKMMEAIRDNFKEIHNQERYDLVMVGDGIMKQTIHGKRRANGSAPFNRLV